MNIPRAFAVLPVAACLSGCLLLPFGVHVNRPFTTGDAGRVRLGIGLSQYPEGQGAVDAVKDGAGNDVNPVPSSASKGKLGTVAIDAAIGVHRTVDVGFGARGVYVLWEPVRAGHWSLSVTPAYGQSSSSADATVTGGTKHEKGKLGNVNVAVLGGWHYSEERPEQLFAYAGGAYNLFSTKITVDDPRLAAPASSSDSAAAPTLLVGVGAGGGSVAINIEAGGTFIKQRTGRSDVVPTVGVILSWTGGDLF